MLNRIKAVVMALILCLAVPPALANEFTDAEYSGKWNSSFIFNVGWSQEKNACASPWMGDFDPALGSYCTENHQAYRLAFDHQFTPEWGMDVSYGDLGNAQGRGFFIGSGASELWNMKVGGWSFAATRTHHFNKNLSVFGKLGIVRAEFTESIFTTISGVSMHGVTLNGVNIINTNRFGPAFGIGAQYDFNDTYGVRVHYENFGKYDIYSTYGLSTPKISLSMISAGLVFKF